MNRCFIVFNKVANEEFQKIKDNLPRHWRKGVMVGSDGKFGSTLACRNGYNISCA